MAANSGYADRKFSIFVEDSTTACETMMEQSAEQNDSFWHLLRLRNFRLLWGAGALSAIGDQFDLIAFPWLVLIVTGDPLAMSL